MRSTIFFLLVTILFNTGCRKDPPGETVSTQKLILTFDFMIDGNPLQRDTLLYINEAGNQYMVNEIQYFISDVVLHRPNGDPVLLDAWTAIHYIDSDLPDTRRWEVYDTIPAGSYDSVSFTFGINEAKNQSLMFLNPPESFMFWPEYLGGGYHYMKLNGKWLDTNSVVQPFDFHLGIGQIYAHYPDSIIGFVQNYFTVSLPNSAFSLPANGQQQITIVMNIENWFRNPNTFDFNHWGGDIMQNQEAMRLGCENGHDVFTSIVAKQGSIEQK